MMKMHILAFALTAAALSQSAGAITATKEYVDRKDATNAAAIAALAADVYTRAETDAKIVELSPPTSLAPATNYTDRATGEVMRVIRALPPGITTNAVCDIVTNVTVTPTGNWVLDESRTYWESGITISEPLAWNGSSWGIEFFNGEMYRYVTAEGGYDALELNFIVDGFDAYADIWYTRPGEIKNTLGLARLVDLPTNHVTRAEMEEAIDAIPEVDTSRFATKAALAAVSNESALVTRLFTSSNVVLVVTNYNSAVNSPKLRILQLNESNEYHVVWAETNNLARTLAAATNDAAAKMAEMAAHTASNYAPRAWSRTTSGMGVDAPSNTTWISTPTTVIAGGLEYAKVVHSVGAIWVLSGNGMMQFDPTTNAYLRISADDGTEIFSIEKTDAVTVGACADGITASRGDGVTIVRIPVNVVATDHPTMYYRRRLDDEVGWIPEADFSGDLGLVYWSGRSGAWECEINMSASGIANTGFFKFTYEQPGSTLIKHNAPMDVSGGIMCTDGVHRVRPVYSNGSVTWEVVP